MFSFFKKKSAPAIHFEAIGTDMHSHLLPGIDDGSPDVETSLELIRGLMALGYKKLITTPHIMQDLYRNTPETIGSALSILKNALVEAQIEVELHAAAEYFMDDYFDEMLENNQPLLTLRDNLVLVEFSFVSAPLNVQKTLFQMQIKGYQPVLAHPERYAYLANHKSFYDELKNAGCLFQLNLLSPTQYYGKAASELAAYLLGKDYINLLGSDLHHTRHLSALQQYGNAIHPIYRLIDSGKLINSTW